jgi:hypothetical protein
LSTFGFTIFSILPISHQKNLRRHCLGWPSLGHFRSISSTAKYRVPPPPPGDRFVLPALTRLDFRGITCYLEALVAIIDAPNLEDIKVSLVDNSVFWHSKLSEFIDRIAKHKLHSRAHILSSDDAISISLAQPGTPTCLRLQLFSKPLSVQLYSMARICVDFSAFLLNVTGLRISATGPSEWLDSIYLGRWPELLSLFTGVTRLHLDANHLTNVVCALLPSEKQPQNLLPALHKLYIPQVERHAPLTKSVVSLITSRRLSGHPILVEYEKLCHASEIGGTGTYAQFHPHYSLTRFE